MLCPGRMHAAWCALRCQTWSEPRISGGFLARAHWIVSSAACLTLLRAGWFVLRVAMSERVVGRLHDLLGCTLYVVSWRCAVAGFHPACVPHASRHVLLVVCCVLDRRLSRGRFLHVDVRRMYAAAAAACRAPHRIWCRSHRRAMWTSTGSSTDGCSRGRRWSSNAAPRSAAAMSTLVPLFRPASRPPAMSTLVPL